MKHNLKITLLIISMFLVTQFIGLYVINSDVYHITVVQPNGTSETANNPALSWIQPPEVQNQSDFSIYLSSIIFSFVIAIIVLFLLTKFKIDVILKGWFFLVVAIALFITFNALLLKFSLSISININYFIIPAVLVSLFLAYLKIFRRNFLVHNITELLIYPGIATLFVPIMSIWTAIILLILISGYDIWAVWHSGIMQKMAKYQINKLKLFAGFFVPYVSKKARMQFRNMKKKGKKMKNKNMKINVAILGGGDVIFPIITSGVVLTSGIVKLPFGLHDFIGGFWPAIFVVAGATLGLSMLLMFSERKKFYPAMPFITAGIFLGLILSYLLL